MNQINLVMSPLGRETILDDDLAGKEPKAAHVRARTAHRSVIGGAPTGSVKSERAKITRWVAANIAPGGDDRWFRRGIDSEIGIITHLNSLLSGGNIRAAVLVDPFFGADALQRLGLRLESQDIELTIVTSWASVDPDTNALLVKSQNPATRLEQTCERAARFLNPRLRVLNLVDRGNQAFHDRYLVTYPHDLPPRAYLLSNSLNKAGANWPFVISMLAPDVALIVKEYVEGLQNGTDMTSGRALTVTLDWSNRGANV